MNLADAVLVDATALSAISARHRYLSSEKLFDRVACARIFCGKTNGDSNPAIEGRERPRDLDVFLKELCRDHFVRLSRFEENEISPGIRAATPHRVEHHVPLLALFDYFQSNSMHVAVVVDLSKSPEHNDIGAGARQLDGVFCAKSGSNSR